MLDISNKLERVNYWMAESQKYAVRDDIFYSGVCFEKAYLLAEELLSLHRSENTFLLSSEKEYLESIIGELNDE